MDAGAHAGARTSVHLRDALVLDGETIAAAGTRAQLVVLPATPPDAGRNAKPAPQFVLEEFSVKGGRLPVRPRDPAMRSIEPGAEIPATTLADVEHRGARYSIVVPFPFRLSDDMPASSYTPTPARTAPASMLNRPTPGITPAPGSSATAIPAPTPYVPR